MNWQQDSLKVVDPAEGAHVGVHGGPLGEAAVLSSLQQVLTSTVVRELKEDPGAVLHLDGVSLLEVPALRQVVQVFSALQHLTTEVRALVDTDPEHTRGLQHKDQEFSLYIYKLHVHYF